MKSFKGFIIVIAGLFIMVTLISLLIPSSIRVSRGVVVRAPAAKVLEQISQVNNWKNWHPVLKSDSIEYLKSSTPNSLEWESNNKTNTFSIVSSNASEVQATLGREGELPIQNVLTILPLADSSAVQVEWKALVRLRWYPWEKFYGIFVEKISGPGYEEALNSLKAYMEKTQ